MELKLPVILNSKQDLTHVHRELRAFIDNVQQRIMRHENPVKYPPITAALRALAVENRIDLRDQASCEKLLKELEDLKLNALTVHISFPADPASEVLQKLIVWFRKEIHPTILIQAGLQPSIAAGIVLRTPNKQFDFTLRQHLYKNRSKLKEALRA